jgi:hypothetical protein
VCWSHGWLPVDAGDAERDTPVTLQVGEYRVDEGSGAAVLCHKLFDASLCLAPLPRVAGRIFAGHLAMDQFISAIFATPYFRL